METNGGKQDFPDLTLGIVINDTQTGKRLQAFEEVFDLPMGAMLDGDLMETLQDLKPKTYEATLLAGSPLIPEPKALVTVTFEMAPRAHPPTAVV